MDAAVEPPHDSVVPDYTIMASRRNGTLYVGMTNDLVRRVHEHRTGAVDGFTKKHGVKRPFRKAWNDLDCGLIRRSTFGCACTTYRSRWSRPPTQLAII
jgi:hypothetical protein